MTCSPPPGKVRHRTFGKLLLLFPVFPRTALQLYSTPYQAYFLQLYSTAVPVYSCTLYTAVPRGTLVLEYQSVPRVSMPYVHACTHTQLSDVHCAELLYTSRVRTRTAVYTQLQLQLYSSIRDHPILSEHSVHVYRPMLIQVLNFFFLLFRMHA